MDEIHFESIPLDDDERAGKAGFVTGGQRFYERAMTFEEYHELEQAGELVITPKSTYYRDKSRDLLGVTICSVSQLSSERNIMLTIHRRYGYPVLHNHDYVEVVLVASGSCTHFLHSHSFAMEKGDICVLAPNALHAISCTRDDTIIINIMIDLPLFDRYFLDIVQGKEALSDFFQGLLHGVHSAPYLLFHTADDPVVQHLEQTLYREYRDEAYGYEIGVGLLARLLFLHLVRTYQDEIVVATAEDHEQNDHVVAILSYLSRNYQDARLDETARQFGYSSAYLSRMIKRYTGKTFSAIVADVRMQKAWELLRDTDMSVSRIAQEVGCFDASHFGKKFRKKFGITPAQCRAGEEAVGE